MARRIEGVVGVEAARVFRGREPGADSVWGSDSDCRVVHWGSSRERISWVEWNALVCWSLARRRLTQGHPLNLIKPGGRISFFGCPTVLVNRRGPSIRLVDGWVVTGFIPLGELSTF
jgi:hypothetical protein